MPLTKEMKTALAPVQKAHDDIAKRRAALEQELQDAQAPLLDVHPRARGNPEHAQKLDRINEIKREIATVSFEHAEHARAIALLSGGKNYMPLPG